ncbi:EAL domain-containing protein [Vibrio fluvialis]|jgi:PAS domain S-box-containing protein|uniref:sensor domain-containing phosphodiesterase n=1 Tax=Vibrio fluvialis TaxID=676 RepID=UPI0005C9F52F|nr:EAL domain-containing protein [Vibrio fluvialis]EKO3382276.1 EAL domain-containing protein [Vibrio fluvialis]MBL4246968.1 EAL domain-containing protein [Vibrio fluvialis]MBL4255488.1 EAL domain-containing protein [Vibrio fluvialis]MBY7792249.1 EAL domain-containing protein [Vibrio fluvialis]MBY7916640.1 EAL domain-containing protein [Vibrio fluvialis]
MEESMKPKTLLNKLIHVFDSSKDGLWYMGYDDRVQFYNSRFYEQFEMPVEDSTLDDWIKLIHPLDRDSFSKRVISHKEGNTTRVISEYRVLTRQGRYLWIEATGIIVEDDDETYMVGCHRDVSESRLFNDYLSVMVHHDSETGLYNRHKWLEVTNACTKEGVVFAVSIRNMHHYIRQWGGRVTTEVVSALSDWFDSRLDEVELYRVSPEVFALRCPYPIPCLQVAQIANEATDGLLKSEDLGFSIAKSDVAIAVINESEFESTLPLNILMQVIDYAYSHGGVSIYTEEVRTAVDRYFVVSDSLDEAISNESIYIALQPIVDRRTNTIRSYEALARWDHPLLGRVSPAEFIPLAEKLDLMMELGYLVIKQACRFIAGYDRSHSDRPSVNINVSVLQLADKDFLEILCNIANEQGVASDRIVLEITESHFLDQDGTCIEMVKKIKSKSFKISLDDFGAGYSSITSLFRLPLHQIKLDRSLVEDALTSEPCRSLIKHLVHHCENQNIELVAEGVETEIIENLLEGIGVYFMQGFGLYRPEPAETWL